MPRYGFCCWRTKPGQYCTLMPGLQSSPVVFAPPPCQRLPWNTITLPARISPERTSRSVGRLREYGVASHGGEPGTKREPPCDAVKFVSDQMQVTIIGACGRFTCADMTTSSP